MRKISMFDIDTSVLDQYKVLEELNPGRWNVGEYLNLKYDLNAAIAFSKLFFPDFVERDGCVLLGLTYKEDIFDQWYKLLDGNISDVESKCNQYELADYFHLNRDLNGPLDSYNKAIDEFGKVLKASWEINCKILFPNKKMIVEIYDEYDTTRITLHS